MGNVVFLILVWPALFLVIGLFSTWYGGYASLVDWWYNEINTSPDSGAWYYGSPDSARRRERDR